MVKERDQTIQALKDILKDKERRITEAIRLLKMDKRMVANRAAALNILTGVVNP